MNNKSLVSVFVSWQHKEEPICTVQYEESFLVSYSPYWKRKQNYFETQFRKCVISSEKMDPRDKLPVSLKGLRKGLACLNDKEGLEVM